jgi:sugar phosphate isomerase/epimerase
MVDVNPVDWLSATRSESASSKLRLGELSFGDASREEEGNLEVFLREMAPRIGHVQARDGRSMGRGTHTVTALGEGQVDWPLILAMLDEAAFTGWLTVRRESEAAGDLARGVKFLRSLSGR